MSRLSFLDLAFFLTESAESPKHVAGLWIFKKPAGSSARWVHNLAQEFASHDQPVPPFDQVIVNAERYEPVDAGVYQTSTIEGMIEATSRAPNARIGVR